MVTVMSTVTEVLVMGSDHETAMTSSLKLELPY
jgi:hypothetical protein